MANMGFHTTVPCCPKIFYTCPPPCFKTILNNKKIKYRNSERYTDILARLTGRKVLLWAILAVWGRVIYVTISIVTRGNFLALFR